jgi:hypothetical protein
MDRLQEYFRFANRGWQGNLYQRGPWVYVRIVRQSDSAYPFFSRRVTDVVRVWFPAARLVKRTEMTIVYNVGTIFDLIRDGVPESLEK